MHSFYHANRKLPISFQVLCNSLWYVTNQHEVINQAALRRKGVLPIPEAFDIYTGYNDLRRKKAKQHPLSALELETHSQALYSILMKPVVNSSESWKRVGDEIKELADCFEAYKKYLSTQSETVDKNRSLNHPVRTIDEHATLEHRHKNILGVKAKYQLLDKAMSMRNLLDPLMFDEYVHIESPFENASQRYRYFVELQLSVPIDIVRFCPGGSVVTVHCIVRVPETRSDAQILTDGARLLQKVKPELKVFHTRAQRRHFKEGLKNITNISPSVADFIYKELALDSSTAEHPITHERLRMIFLGEEGLLTDLRYLNPGRPSERYDLFFEEMIKVVEEVTAADERRHGEAHLSEWLSLKDLMQRVEERCPPDTAVPSKSLVRLQFSPKNPYTKIASTFTAKIPVQYKIQRRQLRVDHPDQHYCAAQLKYLKEKAVELKEHTALFFCGDKAKIPVGEPGSAVSTGVRGKKSIAPCSSTISSLDHDMTKSSITPSVILECKVPDTVSESFVRGRVVTVVNDSIFQASSPFRHATMLAKIMHSNDAKILMKFTDGGVDQRNTLESVKCASICLFLELNLEMMIIARCAPGHSWTNPAERVMSILNIGLQNCALERAAGDANTETDLKKCGSMADIRAMGIKKPELKGKWQELIEPVQSIVRNRFTKLSLKEEPFAVIDPVTDQDIDVFQRHLREHFPELNLAQLQKIHTKKVQSYVSWLEQHCRERQYTFQIRRCEDSNCCLPCTLPKEDLQWLPDPMFDENDRDHFRKYSDVKHIETTEQDRPSLKVLPKKTNISQRKRPSNETDEKNATEDLNREAAALDPVPDGSQKDSPDGDSHVATEDPVCIIQEPPFGDCSLCTTQNARSTVTCTECRKPRVLYSKFKLTERQKVSLAIILSEFEYSCGAPITPPGHSLHGKVLTRSNLSCASLLEIPLYGSGLCRKDLCSHCGSAGGTECQNLKGKFRTVLPLCEDCRNQGILPAVQRPYGKPQKPKK